MSQDLFAAFSDPTPNKISSDLQRQTSTIPTNGTEFSQWTTSVPTALTQQAVSHDDAFDDDEFGDFEDASAEGRSAQVPTPAPATLSKPAAKPLPFSQRPSNISSKPESEVASLKGKIGSHPFAGHMDFLFEGDDDDYDAGEDDLNKDLSMDPQAAMEWSKRVIAEQERQQGHFASQATKPRVQAPVASPPKREPNKLRKKSGYVPPRDPNVLFDVENLSEPEDSSAGGFGDDDFDDFQSFEPAQSVTTAKTNIAKQPSMQQPEALVDLLSLDDKPNPSGANRNQGMASTANSTGQSRPKSEPTFVDDDGAAWDDFEEPLPSTNTQSTSITSPTTPELSAFDSRLAKSITQIASSANSPNGLSPTNIPPPVLLLGLFPPLFSTARTELFEPFTKLPSEQRHLLLSQTTVQSFINGLLATATVLGHIVAGRKQRWKRDQILAQSMRIGASGKGGMKLAGLDRSEAAKEDREVLDVVRVWKQHVGRLKSVVSAVAANGGRSPAVPEISDAMPVKVLKAAEGGIVAPHQCALCGLKREERVAKVDVDVNDSFGEWWLEGTNMHTVCWRFWDNQKGNLYQR